MTTKTWSCFHHRK